ncbi:hypothetical protein IAT38_007991 [Cryptococcus sp. DSM 104549]
MSQLLSPDLLDRLCGPELPPEEEERLQARFISEATAGLPRSTSPVLDGQTLWDAFRESAGLETQLVKLHEAHTKIIEGEERLLDAFDELAGRLPEQSRATRAKAATQQRDDDREVELTSLTADDVEAMPGKRVDSYLKRHGLPIKGCVAERKLRLKQQIAIAKK